MKCQKALSKPVCNPLLLSLALVVSNCATAQFYVGPAAAKIKQGPPAFQVCGVSGTVEARLKECAAKLPHLTPQVYVDARTGERAEWHLVARTQNLMEVWYDKSNAMLWSDAVFSPDFHPNHRSGSSDVQEHVAALCNDVGFNAEAKGFLPYEWSLPSRAQVKRSMLAGLGYVKQTGAKYESYWTSDFEGSHGTRSSYNYYWLYSMGLPEAYKQGYGFSRDNIGDPMDYVHKGLCIFQFAK